MPVRGSGKLHAFFIQQLPEPGGVAELERTERDHLFKTLRAQPGEPVRLLDGRGGEAAAEVIGGGKLRVTAVRRHPEPGLKIVVCCAAPRRQKLDVLLKQLVELGVWQIKLVHCRRSVAQPEGSDRWPALLREAGKQSGNPFLPEVAVYASLGGLLDELKREDAALFFGAVGGVHASPCVPAVGKVAFLVGPEGGFTADEEQLIAGYGAAGLSLGPWILRLETAAVCGAVALRLIGKDEV